MWEGGSVPEPRFYKLNIGDQFSVDFNTFIANRQLWEKQFQIVDINRFKRKWWKIWKPKWIYFVRIKFLG